LFHKGLLCKHRTMGDGFAEEGGGGAEVALNEIYGRSRKEMVLFFDAAEVREKYGFVPQVRKRGGGRKNRTLVASGLRGAQGLEGTPDRGRGRVIHPRT